MATPMRSSGRRVLAPAGAIAMAAAVGLLLLEPSAWAALLPLHPVVGALLPELTSLVGLSAALLPLLLAWSGPRAAMLAVPAPRARAELRPGPTAVPGRGAHAHRALVSASVLSLRL